MSNIIKSSNIEGPSISGSVKVPLAELDKMRANHAALKKLCEELESHQMEVKITLRREGSSYAARQHSDGMFYPEVENDIQSTEYKNLDEVKEAIRKEEESKIKKKMLHLESKLQNASEILKEQTTKEKEKIEKLNEEIGRLKENVKNEEKEKNAVSSKFNELNSNNEKLRKDYNTLLNKKSFWFWLSKKFYGDQKLDF